MDPPQTSDMAEEELCPDEDIFEPKTFIINKTDILNKVPNKNSNITISTSTNTAPLRDEAHIQDIKTLGINTQLVATTANTSQTTLFPNNTILSKHTENILYPTIVQKPLSIMPNQSLKQKKPSATQFTPWPVFEPPKQKFIEFINEEKYDYTELAKKYVSAVNEAENEKPTELDEKTLEYMLELRKTNNISTQTHNVEFTSRGIQTEEAGEDRIYCGFINISKGEPEKYFNLCCFYCDAEYPILYWSEFSDHITYNHFKSEEAYAATENKPVEEKDATESIANETNIFNDFDSINDFSDDDDIEIVKKTTNVGGDRDGTRRMELLPENFDDGDYWESDSDEERSYMRLQNYEPVEDHSYSVDCFNNLQKRIAENTTKPTADEINFVKTPRNVVLDFLDHLKSFPSLWHDRTRYPKSYDYELNELLNIMVVKWGLNFKKRLLRKNWENIKSWYAGMSLLKQENSVEFEQHTYIDYYNKCAEYLIYSFTKKLQKVICDLCNCFCFDLIGMQVHKYRKHNIGQLPYSCNKCDKRFDLLYKLINHAKQHLPTDRKKNALKKIQAPTPQQPQQPQPPKHLACYECNQKFSSAYEYKLHLDLHPKGDCPFACDECSRRFKGSAQLNQHKRLHKPPQFECELCPKKYYKSFLLKLHMDAHNGIYHYVCEWCGRTFVTQQHYTEHRQFWHLGYGFCKICNREYKRRVIYDRHMKTQHRPIYGTIEELSTRRRSKKKGPNLKNRKYEYIFDPVTKRHRLKCPKCDKNFARYSSIYIHAKKIHNFDVPRLQRRRPDRRKLPTITPKKKRIRKRPAQTSTTKGSAMNINVEAEAAVRTITYSTGNSDPDPGPSISKNTSMDVLPDDKSKLSMSMEKFVNEITSNFSFQSPSNSLSIYGQPTEKIETPVVAKMEDFEFILNANNLY